MAPSTLHDAHSSLTLAFSSTFHDDHHLSFSTSPNYRSSSSTRLLFHPNFYLCLVHTEKEQTHLQVQQHTKLFALVTNPPLLISTNGCAIISLCDNLHHPHPESMQILQLFKYMFVINIGYKIQSQNLGFTMHALQF